MSTPIPHSDTTILSARLIAPPAATAPHDIRTGYIHFDGKNKAILGTPLLGFCGRVARRSVPLPNRRARLEARIKDRECFAIIDVENVEKRRWQQAIFWSLVIGGRGSWPTDGQIVEGLRANLQCSQSRRAQA